MRRFILASIIAGSFVTLVPADEVKNSKGEREGLETPGRSGLIRVTFDKRKLSNPQHVRKAQELLRREIFASIDLSKESQAVRKSLQEKCSVNARKVAQAELLQSLAKQWELKLEINEAELAEESLKLDKVVSLKLDNLSRRSVLTSVLGKKFGYRIEHDKIVISTLARCPNPLIVRTYVIEPGELDRMAERIQKKVDPNSWSDKGGAGSIRPFDTTSSLIIRQTDDTHAEITALLANWRAQRSKQEAPAKGATDRNALNGLHEPEKAKDER